MARSSRPYQSKFNEVGPNQTKMPFIIPLGEMRQYFEGRIICENERCNNNDWCNFTYMLPRDGKVLVQCKACNRTFFKPITPNHNVTD